VSPSPSKEKGRRIFEGAKPPSNYPCLVFFKVDDSTKIY